MICTIIFFPYYKFKTKKVIELNCINSFNFIYLFLNLTFFDILCSFIISYNINLEPKLYLSFYIGLYWF